ncbi:MAG: cyclodeaminase/cyclohydrolase family protein [Phycisphaerales bacterium]|nr:cyclodeaminase/cyclohydrolase family protein [Phycisphaerales bacterium]
MTQSAPPRIASMTLTEFVDRLGSKQPTPGGGGASAVSAAIACAAARMVVSFSLGKKSLEEHQPMLESADRRLAKASAMFLALADEDAAAYGVLNEAMALPKDAPDRAQRVRAGAELAVAPPLAMLGVGAEAAGVIAGLDGRSNKYLRSDLCVAAAGLVGACRGAVWSVRANLPLLGEADRSRVESETESMLARAISLAEPLAG